MEWIRELLRDRDLSGYMNWHPVRKFMSEGNDGDEVEFWDDVECGQLWWRTMVSAITSTRSRRLTSYRSRKG